MTNMGWWLAGSTWWKVTTTCAAGFESNFTCPAPWVKNSQWWFCWSGRHQILYWVVATQIFLEFSPRTLGKWSNLTIIFFRWVVQPPTSLYLSDSLSLCFCWLNHDCCQRPLYLKIIWRNCCKNQPVRQRLTTFAVVFVLCCFCGKRDTLYWMNMHSVHARIRTAEMAPSSFLQQDCSKIDDSCLYLSFRGTHPHIQKERL